MTSEEEQTPNEDQPQDQVSSTKAVVSMVAGVMIIAAFMMAKYFSDSGIPAPLPGIMIVLAGIGLMIFHGWKPALTTLTIIFLVFKFLPSDEDPMEVWSDLIDQPVAGDFYGINKYTLAGEKAPNDIQFLFYKVVSFDNSTITFVRSQQLYNAETVNDMLNTKEVVKAKMHDEPFTMTKTELHEYLESHTLGGVFRIESE